jgi:hypothetical protein
LVTARAMVALRLPISKISFPIGPSMVICCSSMNNSTVGPLYSPFAAGELSWSLSARTRHERRCDPLSLVSVVEDRGWLPKIPILIGVKSTPGTSLAKLDPSAKRQKSGRT